jgi:hypothetical protein
VSFSARARLYCRRVLIALDQLANALCGGNPDETLSSRAQKAKEDWLADRSRRQDWWGWALCTFVLIPVGRLFGQRDHPLESVERDEGK